MLVLLILALYVISSSEVESLNSFASSRRASIRRPSCYSSRRDCLVKLDNGEECDLLPIPNRALVDIVQPGEFKLTRLLPSVWTFFDGVYFTLIIRHGRRLALVDFPESASSAKPDGSGTILTDAVEQVMNGSRPYRVDMIYSHAHFDHIGFAGRVFKHFTSAYKGVRIQVWGTKETKDLIKISKNGKAIQLTKVVGKKGRVLRLSHNLVLDMKMLGGHTQKDLAILVRPYKQHKGILMYVDVIFPFWVPPFNFGVTQDLREYINAQKAILKLDFDVLVPGHIMLGTKKDIRTNIRYAKDVISAAQAAVEGVTRKDLLAGGLRQVSNPKARAFGNFYFSVFNVSRKLQIDVCYRILFDKWACRLASFDVVARSHCNTAIFFLLLDA